MLISKQGERVHIIETISVVHLSKKKKKKYGTYYEGRPFSHQIWIHEMIEEKLNF